MKMCFFRLLSRKMTIFATLTLNRPYLHSSIDISTYGSLMNWPQQWDKHVDMLSF